MPISKASPLPRRGTPKDSPTIGKAKAKAHPKIVKLKSRAFWNNQDEEQKVVCKSQHGFGLRKPKKISFRCIQYGGSGGYKRVTMVNSGCLRES
jgi:hypothetical protein